MKGKNLTKLYLALQRPETQWYKDANKWCKQVADKNGLPLANVCAIVSALSPSTNWGDNKKQALQLIKGKRSGFTTYKQGVNKAIAALTSPEPGKLFNEKTGPKTYHFYHNLLQPENPNYVTVDRHFWAIVTGKSYEVGTRIAQYRPIVETCKRHAKRLGLVPCELQAALWVAHREQNKIVDRPF